jgi:hypothetical protein
MSRLPIRWRLTVAFGLALAIVLTAVGIFLHARLRAELDIGIERDLRVRADQLGGLLARSPIEELPQTPSAELEPDENIAQILQPDGTRSRPAVPERGAVDPGTARGRGHRRDHDGPEGDRALDERSGPPTPFGRVARPSSWS